MDEEQEEMECEMDVDLRKGWQFSSGFKGQTIL